MERHTFFFFMVLWALISPLVLSEFITIPLERNENKERRAKALMSLKLRQERLGSSFVETGDVPLDEEILPEKHLATYFGTIKIGSSKFKVLFDTGSCEFWVPSSECVTKRCENHNRFPVTGKEKKLPHGMNIQYLSGKVQGDMVYETITLGDISISKQVVGLGKVVDIELLDDVDWDGIAGFAYQNPSLTAEGVTPIFDNIINQGVLSKKKLANQFAYYIDDNAGAITFGGANCDLLHASSEDCIDKFIFVPVTEETYWTITIKDIRVETPGQEEKSGFCPAGGCKTIVDTGTYLIYGPAQQVAGMMQRSIQGCEHKNMPTLHFDFFGADGKIETVSLAPIDYILKFENNAKEECVVGISPDQDTIWTLGQVFLRSFYTVFDRDENRIGFARLPRTEFKALNSKSKDKINKRHNSPSNNKRKNSNSFRELRKPPMAWLK